MTAQAIPFIQSHTDSSAIALRDETETVSYQQLNERVKERAQDWQPLSPERPVVILTLRNSIESVVDYLSALALDYIVLALHPDCNDEVRAQYIERLAPNALIDEGKVEVLRQQPHPSDSRVSLLLSTSGSTGAGKCVGLSLANLKANSDSILAYLPIEATDITLATLPLSYSYGLSVLNTHLQAGACVAFTNASVFDKAFWNLVRELPVHSLAGVPSFYEMLIRLRFPRMALPDLRYLTQAGGKLSADFVSQFAQYATAQHKPFYVMYGQTEATARIAYVPPHKLLEKTDIVGQAIPGGLLALKHEDGTLNTAENEPGRGELCYRGANVMLGYVETVDDLKHFAPSEWLMTGDIAERDADGDIKIVGRLKRMMKLQGERVNLDAIEERFRAQGWDVRCTGEDNLLRVYSRDAEQTEITEFCKAQLNIPPRNVHLSTIQEWPLLANGKVNYLALTEQFSGA